jgi:hypothetical protein
LIADEITVLIAGNGSHRRVHVAWRGVPLAFSHSREQGNQQLSEARGGNGMGREPPSHLLVAPRRRLAHGRASRRRERLGAFFLAIEATCDDEWTRSSPASRLSATLPPVWGKRARTERLRTVLVN